MKRFKTKSEFIEEFGRIEEIGNWGFGDMNYLYGLPCEGSSGGKRFELYPNLTTGTYDWCVDEHHITDEPHPYTCRNIIIKINTVKQGDVVLARIKAMKSQVWPALNKTEVSNLGVCDITIVSNSLMVDPISDGYKTRTVLTYEEFCNGDIPKSEEQPVKADAYIKSGLLYVRSGMNNVKQFSSDDAWKYNIMSTEDFEKKHKKNLVFKGYDVTVRKDSVKIGCKTFTKDKLQGFREVMYVLHVHDIEPEEVRQFIIENRKDLFKSAAVK